jgi:hypothetical protein
MCKCTVKKSVKGIPPTVVHGDSFLTPEMQGSSPSSEKPKFRPYPVHCSGLESWYERVYFYWSFGFLLARTVTVSLSVAGINDESRLPKSVLFAVPAEGYNVEVSTHAVPE